MSKPRIPETQFSPELDGLLSGRTKPKTLETKAILMPRPPLMAVSEPEKDDAKETLQFFTIPVPPQIAERLYSEAFHDPERRYMNVVLLEILEQGLAGRPIKPPAPESWIAERKVKGKRKKS